MPDRPHRIVSAPFVAVAAWILPGAGYWLLRERARAVTAGVTILILFVLGLLIGGIRVIEVPGFGDHGRPLAQFDAMDEIRDKPWYIPQFLNGPVALIASWASVVCSRDEPGTSQSIAVRSHARTNELGVLYTAVAGLLNLLIVIDSTWRAARMSGRPM